MITTDDPRLMSLPHTEWRPHQRDSIEWIMTNSKKALLVSAPVGSGKTSMASAASTRYPVISCCRTRNLQAANYGHSYGFDILYGKESYPCNHPDANPHANCGDCLFDEPAKCPFADSCEYLVLKHRCASSRKASINYAYFLSAHWPRKRLGENPYQYLFLDEAHQLSDKVVIEHAGTTVNMKQGLFWDLPDFPELSSVKVGLLDRSKNAIDGAIVWLEECVRVLGRRVNKLNNKWARGNPALGKQLRDAQHFEAKLQATLDALSVSHDDWYIRSGPEARTRGDEILSGFEARPLTARYHFPNYFLGKHQTILMSATMGDFAVFAQELGISDYDILDVPSNWPAETRSILALDAPPMGNTSTSKDPNLYNKQADLIAGLIRDCPSDWYGLIHTTSKAKAYNLAERLSCRGLGERVWVTPQTSTDEQMRQWELHKQKSKGAIALAWTWHEGVDLGDVNICVIAGVQFGFLGDEYERERMSYDGKMYRLRAAWAVEQMCGRVRRGLPEHYDTDGKRRKLVAIADGNWRMLDSYWSKSFKESLVTP